MRVLWLDIGLLKANQIRRMQNVKSKLSKFLVVQWLRLCSQCRDCVGHHYVTFSRLPNLSVQTFPIVQNGSKNNTLLTGRTVNELVPVSSHQS